MRGRDSEHLMPAELFRMAYDVLGENTNLRSAVYDEIRDIQQRLAITTVLVTHDQSEALSLCDRIAVMREGHIEQIGTPLEIYEHPATRFVAGFVGRINELACSIEERIASSSAATSFTCASARSSPTTRAGHSRTRASSPEMRSPISCSGIQRQRYPG